jgi:hypothetical protein
LSPLPIEMDLQKLYVGNNNENHDERYLFIVAMYADGTPINPLAPSTSTVRIDSPSKTHGNVAHKDKNGNDLQEGSTARISATVAHFATTIKPIGADFAANMEDVNGAIAGAIAERTAVYVIVIAMEEDSTSTEAINAARTTMVTEVGKKANETIRAVATQDLMKGNPPKFDPTQFQKELKGKVIDAAKDATLTTGWWIPQILPTKLGEFADPDDYVGMNFRKFTFGELLAAGTNWIPFELECSNSDEWEGSYMVKGRIRRK